MPQPLRSGPFFRFLRCHEEQESGVRSQNETRLRPGESEDDVMSTFTRETESLSMSALSVVLIGPDEQRRRVVAKALAGPQAKIARVIERYPEVGDLAEIIEADYDVAI